MEQPAAPVSSPIPPATPPPTPVLPVAPAPTPAAAKREIRYSHKWDTRVKDKEERVTRWSTMTRADRWLLSNDMKLLFLEMEDQEADPHYIRRLARVLRKCKEDQ